MQRIVENEHCVDIEERVNGIWAVVRCSLRLKTPPRKSFFKIPKTPKKPNKKTIIREDESNVAKRVKTGLTTKDYRDKNKLKRYNLSKEEYLKMIKSQDNKCAICREPQPLHINGGELNIDHDHETGEVRGLLCNYCNTGIGMLRDDATRMKRAIAYLKRKR